MNTDVAIIAHLITGFYQDQERGVVTPFHMTSAVARVQRPIVCPWRLAQIS